MIRTCIIRLEIEDETYKRIAINDMMKTVLFDCGILEIDFALAVYFAKANWHVITIHHSIIEYVEDYPDFYWQSTKYGEFICKVDCQKELV